MTRSDIAAEALAKIAAIVDCSESDPAEMLAMLAKIEKLALVARLDAELANA